MTEEEKDDIYLDETASSDEEAAIGIYERSEESERPEGAEESKEAGNKKRKFRFHFRNPLTIIDMSLIHL